MCGNDASLTLSASLMVTQPQLKQGNWQAGQGRQAKPSHAMRIPPLSYYPYLTPPFLAPGRPQFGLSTHLSQFPFSLPLNLILYTPYVSPHARTTNKPAPSCLFPRFTNKGSFYKLRFTFYILIINEKVLVFCEKLLLTFLSNLYVLKPPESEKKDFMNLSISLSVCSIRSYTR